MDTKSSCRALPCDSLSQNRGKRYPTHVFVTLYFCTLALVVALVFGSLILSQTQPCNTVCGMFLKRDLHRIRCSETHWHASISYLEKALLYNPPCSLNNITYTWKLSEMRAMADKSSTQQRGGKPPRSGSILLCFLTSHTHTARCCLMLADWLTRC